VLKLNQLGQQKKQDNIFVKQTAAKELGYKYEI
jgi:hypothetical protein